MMNVYHAIIHMRERIVFYLRKITMSCSEIMEVILAGYGFKKTDKQMCPDTALYCYGYIIN